MAALTCLRNLSRIVNVARLNSTRSSATPFVNALNSASYRWIHRSTVLNADRKYNEDHEWVSVENGVGTIGISEYAQEKLGDVVYASLPDVNDNIDMGDEFGSLESVKAASDLYAPVSGEVVDINTDVLDKPALINSSPLDEGWLIKVRLSDKEEMDKLMNETEYENFTAGLS